MPENNNNNNNFNNGSQPNNNHIFDLPLANSSTQNIEPTTPEPINQSVSENKPIIELPQSYYDQLAKEELEARQKEEQNMTIQKEFQENNSQNGQIMAFGIITAIITYFSLYGVLNIHELTIFVIPAYIVLGTILTTLKKKKDNQFPSSIMVGGMIVAVITFILSMLQEEQMDMWTYYAIAGAITAFLGMIISNIIIKIMTDRQNIKALQTVGYLLFFTALFAIPAYLYTNYRDEFYKFVFQKQTVVQAETEEEFVMKTLKTRYNIEFTCDKSKEKHQINQDNRKLVERTCQDPYGNQIVVVSTAYNEGSTQYVVTDNYIDVIFLKQIKETIIADITSMTNAKEVTVSLYPEENCTFVGDCANCEEYLERKEKENDINNQFKVSTELNLKKEIGSNSKDFINSKKYKFIIEVTSQFDENTINAPSLVDNILNRLNQIGYKNTYGYIITLNDDISSDGFELQSVLYQVKGNTNDTQTFKDPEVVKTQ